MKKRFIAGLMALCCILSFSACNKEATDETSSTSRVESSSGGIIDDAGDVVEDAGEAVDDAGDTVSSEAQNAVDDIKEDMSTNRADKNK